MISMIAALAKNKVMGKNNQLPWNLPADLDYFRQKVVDKVIIVGQKTFESVGSHPFSKVKNIILSNAPNFKAPEGCLVASSIDQAIEMAEGAEAASAKGSSEPREIMVCGGASVYKQFLPMAQRLYLTYIHESFEGDTYFPEMNINEWKEVSREDHQPDAKNKYSYSFVILERKKAAH